MGEVKKWSVTYTKHVKQKRKVYQDGILELHPSTNKVILYDDCEQLLGSRFVKRDDVFTPGESLAFETYLVDIGDCCPHEDDCKSIPKFNQCQNDPKIDRASASFHTTKFERKRHLGQKKARSINISSSQKLIRDYKKNEMTKYGPSPGCPETTKSSKQEWQVLYTTQITQKAKKYHDGYLQLHSCGSQRKQVLLYDETRRFLESRFLKMDDIIKSGESIAFDGHLVDIGELNKDNKPPVDSKVEGRVSKIVGNTKGVGGQNQIHFHGQLPVGEYQKEVPSKRYSISTSGAGKMPGRAAHEILAILRKTKSEMDVPTPKSLSKDGLHASDSPSFFHQKQHLRDAYVEGSSIMVLDEENTSRKTDTSEIPKYEDKQVLLGEISESDKAGFESTSSFFVGSGATNILQHVPDTDYAVSRRTHEDTPSFEPKSLAVLELDLKPKTAAVLQDLSGGDLESENRTELFSCKENPTGGAPAAVSSSDTRQLSMEVEPVDVSKDISTKKTDDFPSFDLGF